MRTLIRKHALTTLALLLLSAGPVLAGDADGTGQDPPGSSAPTAQAGTTEAEAIDLVTKAANLLLNVVLL